MKETGLVITPARYRVLWQEAERQISRTLGEDGEKVRDAALNSTATVLHLLGVEVDDGRRDLH